MISLMELEARLDPSRMPRHGTLYAFSTENWRRPAPEVQAIIRLLSHFIKKELGNFQKNNIRLCHLGHLESLPARLQRQVGEAMELTKDNTRLTVNVCFSYGGRDDVLRAVKALVAEGIPAEAITEQDITDRLYTAGAPDPDLVIRTGGDMRVSNFLLWQCAYAELYFTDAYWPDFGREDIDIGLAEYGRRKRKFGGLLDDDKSSRH